MVVLGGGGLFDMSEVPLYSLRTCIAEGNSAPDPRPSLSYHCLSLSCMGEVYRGTSLVRNRRRLGPYSRTMPRALWGS